MSETLVSDAPTSAAVPGWFGKIPNLGDFVSRRLPDDFVHGWDEWLQHGMAQAHAELGGDWLARYLVAPVRRFWIAPSVLGSDAWAGVMMPSVDRVGRHFPLTIALPVVRHAHSLAAALGARDWFAAIDGVARRVLDLQFSADDLERALAQVAPPGRRAAIDADEDEEEDRRVAQRLLSPFTRIDTSRGAEPLTPCCVWWCGDATQFSRFDCFASLPPAASFAGLLVEPG